MAPKGKAQIDKKNQALERLEIVYAPVASIKPNDYNPNRQSDNDFDLLLRSISEDGFTQPIVAVRTEDPELAKTYPYTIVDGEHRWRAANHLGYKEVPVAIVPMTLEQARIATLRHNRARGSEDIELATQVLRDLEKLGALDWAQDSLQLSDDELDRLLEDIPAPEALAAEAFTQAWEPQKDAVFAEKGEIAAVTGGTQQDALTPAAIEAQRQFEKRIVEARNQEERDQITKERAIYRLNLTFTNDEAKIVKQALGDQPAIRLLELCQANPQT